MCRINVFVFLRSRQGKLDQDFSSACDFTSPLPKEVQSAVVDVDVYFTDCIVVGRWFSYFLKIFALPFFALHLVTEMRSSLSERLPEAHLFQFGTVT